MKRWDRDRLRAVLLLVLVAGGAYWAGAHFASRPPSSARAQRGGLLLPPPVSGQQLTPEEEVNVRVYQRAAAAVANILTRAIAYDFFFNPVPVEGAGSGFLIDAAGHILTNDHVIAGAASIEVVLGDRSRYRARVVGGDQRNDLALLQIDLGDHPVTPLELGDSDRLQVGQRVLAIGNPFGFQSTLTTGVVSALGRTVQTGPNTFIERAIQTDAPINRGNSGGPLLNTQGQVVGINAAIFSPTGTTAGIGFAIPINTARRVVNDLLRYGRVRRAWLGVVRAEALDPTLAALLGLPVRQGVLVEQVEPGSPAARAGLRGGTQVALVGLQQILLGGDVVVALDEQAVTTPAELELAVSAHRPGDRVVLTLWRGGQRQPLPVVLGER